MDIFSHALIGRILATHSSQKNKIAAAIFAAAPDVLQFPLYVIVAYLGKRPFSLFCNENWDGFRADHPMLSWISEIPHSIWMLAIVYFIAKELGLNIFLMIASYASHLLTDILTHTGEWSIKLFWPIQTTIEGYIDMWAWGFNHLAISWITLLTFLLLLETGKKFEPRKFAKW